MFMDIPFTSSFTVLLKTLWSGLHCHPQLPSQLYFSPLNLLLLSILNTLLICFIVCSSLLECEPHEGMNEGLRLIFGITKKTTNWVAYTAKIYYPPELDARTLKSRCWQVGFLL